MKMILLKKSVTLDWLVLRSSQSLCIYFIFYGHLSEYISDRINEVKTKKYARWELKKWPLVALTGWLHLRGVFIGKCMSVLPGQKKGS